MNHKPKHQFQLKSRIDADGLWNILKGWKDQSDAGHPVQVTVEPYEPTRSIDQNKMLWEILSAFSEQLEWPINGEMKRISAEDWKDILSASFKSEMVRLSQTIDGRIVMLGLRTSRMRKQEFTEFVEFLMAVAAERGVVIFNENCEEV